MDDVRWLGFDWEDRLFYASDYFGQLYEWAVQLIKAGKAYVCDLTADEVRQYRGTLTEPGKESPYRNRSRRGEPRPVRAHEGRRVPRRLAHPARQDRHGLAQSQHARPGDVPHPARRAPPHRQRVVHLPDVRLRARPVGFDRRHHPLHLHAGVRGPPAALRLVRRAARHLSSAADRVRPAQPHLHPAEQAQAAHAGAGGPRARLGRSAHADALRHPAARLHARSDPQFLRRDRRLEDQRHHRAGAARALRPRGPEQARRCA